ncbi:MAG: biopolymer transporter ExbD [Bacteroidota bacterium]|uniref:Biopolymer transport exbD protein n=1 Tax=Christiangramia flava JLT2011 TaxID=1229726 RepID=A0A1L7I5S9_9FLAO|nr:biopolymer transporter ExbD [Christiangramia flava]APU68584.1 Biopolymer transport exbD protein [Christiangramia flava JLT2011]MAM18300.1 biopolymer transporter ExbD [Christiangramia sp.]MEE2772836.1 biopolymer transporter ExbD [Bacteroidota bacterium]OSS40629.1 Biopolymer transport exbD protein [Christiangramia flava JLT2011]
MAKRSAPEVNAGSMADIAFLLLIFFLVTTTIETDKGISRKLPPWQPEEQDPPQIKQKNIFTVLVNSNNQLLVEEEEMELSDLREAAVEFLDNGGGSGDDACSFCQGAKDPASSDNPRKAIISLVNNRGTEYGTYIAVQNELVAAYNQLRDREAQRMFGTTFTEMEKMYNDPNYNGDKDALKEKIDVIQDMIPQKLSEAEPTS